MSLAGGYAPARAIQAALKLGVFDTIAKNPLDSKAIANSVRCDWRATQVLCDALAALNLLVKSENRYDLTEATRRYFVSTSAEFAGGMIAFDDAMWPLWQRLETTIRSGEPARAPDMFQNSREETARFIRAMDSLVRARGDAEWVAQNIDLSDIDVVADIGGGPGTYVTAMLRRYPRMRAQICDLPATLEIAREVLAEREASVASRIELVEFDYLKDSIRGPVDAIFLSNIIHGEDEATVARMIANCAAPLRAGGRIFIKDHIMSADLTEPAAGAVFALHLLLATRGRDYSFDEVAGWLASAGFEGIKCIELPAPRFTSSIVVARKP